MEKETIENIEKVDNKETKGNSCNEKSILLNNFNENKIKDRLVDCIFTKSTPKFDTKITTGFVCFKNRTTNVFSLITLYPFEQFDEDTDTLSVNILGIVINKLNYYSYKTEELPQKYIIIAEIPNEKIDLEKIFVDEKNNYLNLNSNFLFVLKNDESPNLSLVTYKTIGPCYDSTKGFIFVLKDSLENPNKIKTFEHYAKSVFIDMGAPLMILVNSFSCDVHGLHYGTCPDEKVLENYALKLSEDFLNWITNELNLIENVDYSFSEKESYLFYC